jgi:stage V sporulation protein SpoVS
MEPIRVSANSRTAALAGAVAGSIRKHNRAEVQAMGASAVDQAIKALAAVAVSFLGGGWDQYSLHSGIYGHC